MRSGSGIRTALYGCVVMVGFASALPARTVAQQATDLPGSDKAISAPLDNVFSIGTFDGADWETFGDVRGVAFDGAGNIYIFDTQNFRVVEVDKTGKFVREVGKQGEGPGELRVPVSFTVLRNGTIVIADMGHRAYVIYGPDGAYQRMVSFGGDGNVVRVGQIYPDPRGESVLTGGSSMTVSMSVGPGGPPKGPETRPIERVALSGEEAIGTTLVDAWKPPVDSKPQEISGGGLRFRAAMAGPRTFEPGLFMGPLPDGGVAYADSSTYTVKVTDGSGALQRILRRPFTPKPVTESMQAAEKKRRLAELEAGQGPRVRMMVSSGGAPARPVSPDAVKEMMKGQIDQMQFYPELPVIMNLSTGWGGKIWVVRRGAKPADVGPVDVLTPSGQYVGTYATGTLPFAEDLGKQSMQVAFGPDGLVAHVEKDEMDVPKVVVQRLPAVLR
ncbi:MAG: 6-bladed beta-propeller [Gemmatimonadetes bacterium]|nr:6-bladed beta-propeller [Gemmatimonadota bacterium]